MQQVGEALCTNTYCTPRVPGIMYKGVLAAQLNREVRLHGIFDSSNVIAAIDNL